MHGSKSFAPTVNILIPISMIFLKYIQVKSPHTFVTMYYLLVNQIKKTNKWLYSDLSFKFYSVQIDYSQQFLLVFSGFVMDANYVLNIFPLV